MLNTYPIEDTIPFRGDWIDLACGLRSMRIAHNLSKRALRGEYYGCQFNGTGVWNTTYITGALMVDCTFNAVQCEQLHVVRGELRNVKFVDCTIDIASFEGAVLNNVKFVNCHLIGVDFSKSVFEGVTFDGCKFHLCNFEGTSMSEEDYEAGPWSSGSTVFAGLNHSPSPDYATF
jgi:uncharacterized protein YjbI with pentapeptide repeats